MILILICWFYTTIICYSYGLILLWLIEKITSTKSTRPPFSLICLIGLAQLSALTTILSLFINIGALAIFLITSIPVILSLYNWKGFIKLVSKGIQEIKQTPRLYIILLISIQVTLAIKCSSSIFFHYDTGFYHAQSIRWIETYGVTPGLVNLLAPLGVDSMWLQPNALFGFAFLLDNPMHKVIGLTICWSIYLILGRIKDLIIQKRQPIFSSVFYVLTLIPLIELASNLTSPSTDEPAAIFVLLAIALTLEFIETEEEDKKIQFGTLIVSLSAYAFAIKLSTMPILICSSYILWISLKKRLWNFIFLQVLIIIEFILPKSIRTAILSGYPIYPFPYLDIFNVDWKMSKENVFTEMQWIKSWARLPFGDMDKVLGEGIGYWFPSWVTTFLGSPIAWSGMICLMIFIIGLCKRDLFQVKILIKFSVIYITAILGVTYWFITAPYIRFGFGFLWALNILLITPMIVLAISSKKPAFMYYHRNYKILAVALSVSLLPIILYSESTIWLLGSGIVPSQTFPVTANYRKPDGYTKAVTTLKRACGFNLLKPVKGQLCWYSDIPCSPFSYGKPSLRGSDLHEGFENVDICTR